MTDAYSKTGRGWGTGEGFSLQASNPPVPSIASLTPDGLPGTRTAIFRPSGAFPDSSGGVVFSDTGNFALRFCNSSAGSVVTTLAGMIGVSGTTGALLAEPRSVRPYNNGWLVTDYRAHVVRFLLPNGTLVTSAGRLGAQGSTGDGGLGKPRSRDLCAVPSTVCAFVLQR